MHVCVILIVFAYHPPAHAQDMQRHTCTHTHTYLKQEVHRLWLSVVRHVEGHNLLYKLHEVLRKQGGQCVLSSAN
jgi:hypothetical protein